jgi:hypothetical protein
MSDFPGKTGLFKARAGDTPQYDRMSQGCKDKQVVSPGNDLKKTLPISAQSFE